MVYRLKRDTSRSTLPTDRNGVPLQSVYHPQDGGLSTVTGTAGLTQSAITVDSAANTDVIRIAISGGAVNGGIRVVFGDGDSPAPSTSSGMPLLQRVGGQAETFFFKGYTTLHVERIGGTDVTVYVTRIKDTQEQL